MELEPTFDNRDFATIDYVGKRTADFINEFREAYTDALGRKFERHFPYEEGLTDQLMVGLSRAGFQCAMQVYPTSKGTEKTEGHDFKLVFQDNRGKKHIRYLQAKVRDDKDVDYLAGYDEVYEKKQKKRDEWGINQMIEYYQKQVTKYRSLAQGWELSEGRIRRGEETQVLEGATYRKRNPKLADLVRNLKHLKMQLGLLDDLKNKPRIQADLLHLTIQKNQENENAAKVNGG
ncbi:hypothetical protein FRC07_009477 [Ceratobasidium sp. 392]|nr:hypothetical protein FRC07_009477 [Ceratobasidium sp. 392]